MRLNVLKNHVPIHDVMVETPDPSERYEIFFGRSEDCHIRIEDPLISRHHFVIKNESGKWLVEKITNLGAISLNGLSAPRMDLNEGDEIKCGAYSIFVTGLPEIFVKTESVLPQSPPPAEIFIPAPVQAIAKIAEPAPLEDNSLSLDELDVAPETTESPEIANESDFKEEEFEEQTDEAAPQSFDQGEVATSDFADMDGALQTSDLADAPEEKTQFFKAFVNYQLVLFGEHAPYDRYIIDQELIYIGRDTKKCQIILDDPEVSTVHAVIRKTNIEVTLEDLNSSNGTILNGERINKIQLNAGDEFVIGSTSFTLESRSDLLDAESDRLMPVESGQVVEKEEIEEEVVDLENGDVDFNSDAPPEKSILKRVWKNPQSRKKLIYGLAAATIMYVVLDPKEPEVPTVDPKANATKSTDKTDTKPKIELSKEQQEIRNQAYELGINFFEQEKYHEAEVEFKKVIQIDPDYKKVATYLEQTIAGLKRLEEIAVQERAEKERIATKKLIEELVEKAKVAVKERQVTVAESLFAQVVEKDPENIDVQQLKLEIEAWQKEEERKLQEIAAKESARKNMVDALSPGKTFYLKREWYRATLKLEEFLRRKGSDEDLVKEASDMLSDSKNQLASELGPLIGKARSLKEGQDLKSAYEAFLDVLKVEPTNSEALNEIDEIKSQLETRSKRIYREAIIAESLSLFNDAKEKFQEVQQISPTDSEYYRKANDKLKNYLE